MFLSDGAGARTGPPLSSTRVGGGVFCAQGRQVALSYPLEASGHWRLAAQLMNEALS